MVFWDIKLLCNRWKFEKTSTVEKFQCRSFAIQISSQIQNLWNRESKSNINRSVGGFKQSDTFNGDSYSLIDKGIFYHATFNFKMFIFSV